MTPPRFDPFNRRICRDIRNNLSSSLSKALSDLDVRLYLAVADKYLAMEIDQACREYIYGRVDKYNELFSCIKEDKANFFLNKVSLIWDLQLFFELHEILEHEWLQAKGKKKKMLQGLIRAAGTYVHLQQGNQKGAQKMARKAYENLYENREHIPEDINIDALFFGLTNLKLTPPKISVR